MLHISAHISGNMQHVYGKYQQFSDRVNILPKVLRFFLYIFHNIFFHFPSISTYILPRISSGIYINFLITFSGFSKNLDDIFLNITENNSHTFYIKFRQSLPKIGLKFYSTKTECRSSRYIL